MNRHVVLTSGRSGSNHLANTLNLHPNLVNYGEVLGPWTLPHRLYRLSRTFIDSTTAEYLDYVYSSGIFYYAAQLYSALSHVRKAKRPRLKRLRNILGIGIKDFFTHFQGDTLARDFLVRNDDIAIIRLWRENLLRRYLSLVSMQKSNIVATERAVPHAKITVNVDDMLDSLRMMEQQRLAEANFLAELRGHRLLSLRYEDYFASHESIASYNQQIFAFLGVGPMRDQSHHKKILPLEFAEVIRNYDEFKAGLSRTHYAHYLDY